MEGLEENRLKEIITEALQKETPKWLTVSEKLVIPTLLGLATLFIAYFSYSVQKNQVDIANLQIVQDSINFKRSKQLDSLVFHKNYQLKLVELFYNDLTSNNSDKNTNALNLLALMDDSLQKQLSVIPWIIKDSIAGKDFVDERKDLILSASNIKVLSRSISRNTAAEINDLLVKNGAKAIDSGDPVGYTLSKNEIVYYSTRHINQCIAVQLLLSQNGYGNFPIRRSSGAHEGNDYFKIYVAHSIETK